MIVVFGLVFSLFATQNTIPVVVTLAGSEFEMPLYMMVIASLFFGLLLSFIMSLFESFSSSLAIWGRDSRIKQDNKEIQNLNDRIHQLELENTRLKAKEDTVKRNNPK